MKFVFVILTASLLSGCATLLPLLATSFPGSIVSGAGGVVGGEVARSEIAYVKAWRKCQRLYKTKQQRQTCIAYWRRMQ